MNSSNLKTLALLPYSDLIRLREKAEWDVNNNRCGCPACQLCRVLSLEIIVAATHFIVRQEMIVLEQFPIERLLLEMDIPFFITDIGAVYLTDQSAYSW